MPRLILILLALAALSILPAAARAQTTEIQSARSLGMGGAFRALAYDGSAVDLNPAAMAQFSRFNFEGGYFRSGPAREYGVDVSIIDSLTNPTATGMAFQYRKVRPGPLGEGGLDQQRYVVGVGIPLIPRKLYLGTNTKFVRTTYPGAVPARSGSRIFTGDVGVLYRPLQMLAVAATFDNLIDGGREEAPRSITGGVAVLPAEWIALTGDVLVDLASREDDEIGWNVGSQVTIARNLALRAGLYEEALSKRRVWTAGFGLLAETGSIDYAVTVPFPEEGEARKIARHHLTLSFFVF